MAKRGEQKYKAWVAYIDPEGETQEVIIDFYADPDLAWTGEVRRRAEASCRRRGLEIAVILETWHGRSYPKMA